MIFRFTCVQLVCIPNIVQSSIVYLHKTHRANKNVLSRLVGMECTAVIVGVYFSMSESDVVYVRQLLLPKETGRKSVLYREYNIQ